jgi:hypothetical protein
MKDYYRDGVNVGRGESWRNNGHDYPQSEIDRYSYRRGIEEGEYRRRISDEVDREMGY